MRHTRELKLNGRVGAAAPTICIVLAMIAIALLTRDALGQEVAQSFDLVGIVTDGEAGQPLVGAFVSLTGSEWGSVTDENGRFVIPDIYAGPVSISAEQLGYETLVWEGSVAESQDPLTLALAPEPVLLEGLQVVTDRFQTRRNRSALSVHAFDRSALATSPQETLLDFVALRAGSVRTRCDSNARGDVCLRMRGQNVEPVVYVDEVPVLAGLDYLEVFQPSEFYMVEIFASGRHIRAYTNGFMERAAKQRLRPIALLY